MLKMKSLIGAVAAVALACSASAATVVNPVGVTGHDGGNWPSSLGHLTDMLNGNNVGFLTGDHAPGMTVNDPNDPSTWTYNGGNWPEEWKANSRLTAASSHNNKIGWVVIDLGADVSGLENMYLWNVRHQSTTENVTNFNLYIAGDGAAINALPAMPNSKTTTGDYVFDQDWVSLGNHNLAANPSNNNGPQGTVSLLGSTGRYLGIEILTAGGVANRVGLAQVEITQDVIPEPSSLALLGLGGLMMIKRRRRG